MDSSLHILNIIAMILALALSIIGHEIMHGVAAYYYGDDTAKRAGRLSINPIVHIDPIGTILVPAILYISNAGFLFGWAKPVPVNIARVTRHGGEPGAIVVSLAGVTYNFFLAILSAIALKLIGRPEGIVEFFLFLFFGQSLLINLVLGVFNLWPIPPLDGANALIHFARWINFQPLVRLYEYLFPYGMIILILILATPISSLFFAPITYLLILLSKLFDLNFLSLITLIERI